MNLDISSIHMDLVKKILDKHIPGSKIWAFGSRSKGTAKNTSDLDLVIVSDKKTPSMTLTLLKSDFEESDLPFKVDILDWQSISNEFQKIIKKEYLVFQEGRQI